MAFVVSEMYRMLCSVRFSEMGAAVEAARRSTHLKMYSFWGAHYVV